MRTRRLCWLLAIQLLFCTNAGAQDRGTRSHRLIPMRKGEKRPTLADFMSPDLLEMRQELRRLRSDRRRIEKEGRQLREQPTLQIQEPVYRPSDQKLVDRLNRSIVETIPESIREEGDSLQDSFAEQLGPELTETLESDAIPFDPNDTNSFWTNIDELREAISEPMRQATEQYRQAMKAYNETWPANSLPPKEWVRKVQPFINPELVRQLAEIRSTNASADKSNQTAMNLNQFQPEAHGSNSSQTNTAESNENSPYKMLESVIGAVDRSTTDWLKSRKAQGDRRSMIWKSFRERAKQQLAALNRTATQYSNQITKERSQAWSKRSSNSNLANSDTASRLANVAGFVLALSVLAAVVTYMIRSPKRSYWYSNAIPIPIDSNGISDKETLLTACHQLAHRCLGSRSIYWNHRRVFLQLREQDSVNAAVFDQLAHVYERARYARRHPLSAEEVKVARQLFAQIEDLTPVNV